jgi:hypothetical protein
MAKDPKDLLEALRVSPANVKLTNARKALEAFGFQLGRRRKKNVELWKYESVTYTLHVPHPPGGPMTRGAVRELIRQIESAKFLQERRSREG